MSAVLSQEVQQLIAPRLDLTVPTSRMILIKCTFTGRQFIPEGVECRHLKRHDSDHAKHAREGGQPKLAEVGRVRDGRVDTGAKVIDENSVTWNFHRSLVAAGYRLYDLAYKEDPRKPGRYTVIYYYLTLEATSGDYLELHGLREEELRFLGGLPEIAWQAYVWDNSAVDNCPTVNLTGKHERHGRTRTLRIQDGQLLACDK